MPWLRRAPAGRITWLMSKVVSLMRLKTHRHAADEAALAAGDFWRLTSAQLYEEASEELADYEWEILRMTLEEALPPDVLRFVVPLVGDDDMPLLDAIEAAGFVLDSAL